MTREDGHQPNVGTGVNALATEMEEESIDVWNGVVGLVTLGEAIDTSDDTDLETDTEGHGGTYPPIRGLTPRLLRRHQELRCSHQVRASWSTEEDREMSLRIWTALSLKLLNGHLELQWTHTSWWECRLTMRTA